MDLRHARTFVTVAELGTVSKAAQHLRIAQPALSRQISDLEQELGIKLFDRVGRRLMLTGEGEQLLGDCRTLLNCAAAVGERAQQLQRGDTGMLKVASSPQIIEGTMSEFLRRYSQHYPKVQVKLIEAIGWTDIVGMLDRGDIHLGQNLKRAVPPNDQRFASYPWCPSIFSLPVVQQSSLEATGRSKLPIWRRIRCCSWTPATSFVATSTLRAASPVLSRISPMKAGRHIRSLPWPRAGMALPSYLRACGPIGIVCASLRSPIEASRCRSR